jgi:Urb2/Npa2 family
MPKRKRRTNPFLSGILNVEADDGDAIPASSTSKISSSKISSSTGTTVDRHLVAFVNESKSQTRTISSACALSVEAIGKELENALDEDRDRGDSSSSSLADAAALLLPWAVHAALAGLDNQGRRALVFRALCDCLEYLDRSEDAKADPGSSRWHRSLTQSALYKLVPAVAHVAVDTSCHSNKPTEARPKCEASQEGNDACGADLLSSAEDLPMFARRALDVLLNLFAPTLDVACKVVLLPVVDSMGLRHLYTKRHILGDDPAVMSDGRSVVLVRVLTWLSNLAASAGNNPKTTFSIFASPPIMLALIRCHNYFDRTDRAGMMLCDKPTLDVDARQAVVEELLCVVLDSKHLDGFRSLLLSQRHAAASPSADQPLTTPHSQHTVFQSYQDELFTGLVASLSLSEFPRLASPERQPRMEDVLDMAKAVPVLLNGFMTRAEEWYRQQQATKAKSQKAEQARSETFARLQFRMFDKLTQPLRLLVTEAARCDQSALVAVAISSLATCLETLSRCKGYIPAHDESDRQQFYLLEQMALAFLEFPVVDAHFHGMQQLGCVLVGLRWLLKLDHRLFQERLTAIYSLCCACRDVRLSGAATSLLVSLVDTHCLLRQQTSLVVSLLRLVDEGSALREQDLEVLIGFLNDSRVRQAIVAAIRECPISQAKHQLEAIYAATEKLSIAVEVKVGKLKLVEVVAQLLASRMRLDSGNVVDVDTACRFLLDGPVSQLFDRARRLESSCRVRAMLLSLSLCGMHLALQERCAFLRSNDSLTSIPLRFSKVLDSWREWVDGDRLCLTESDAAELDALAHGWVGIWCHRLREIHSALNRWELIGDGESLDESALLSEASSLTVLAMEAACRQKEIPEGDTSMWAVLAANFSIWLPYAADRHVFMFVRWLFTVIVVDPISSYLPPKSSGLCSRSTLVGIERETGLACRLLRDTSFLSHSRIASQLHRAAISCSIHWTKWVLDSVDAVREDPDWRSLGSILDLQEVGWLEEPDLIGSVTPLPLLSSTRVSSLGPWLLRALRPLRVINGLQQLVCGTDDASQFLALTCRLDHVFRSLARSNLRRATVSCVGAVRLSMAMTLRQRSLKDKSFASVERVSSFCKSALASALSLHDKLELDRYYDVMSEAILALSIGNSSLIRQATRILLTVDNNCSTILCAVKEAVTDQVASRGHVSGFLLTQCRSIIDAVPRSCSEPGVSLARSIRDILWECISIRFTWRENTHSHHGVAREEWLTLGDLILVSSTLDLGSFPTETTQFKLLEKAMSDVAHPSPGIGSGANQGCRYFIACVSATTQNPLARDLIVNSILEMPSPEDPFLEASFCQLTANLSSESITDSLKSLVGPSSDSDSSQHRPSRAHFLRLFLQCVDKSRHADIISTHGQEMLDFALSHLHNGVRDELSTRSAIESCGAVKELLRSHELVPLRDRDLARVLSHMSAILGPGSTLTPRSTEESGGMKRLPTDLFLHCSLVFVAMFQRYTKHLYACVPSVISVLHSFLGRVLYDTSEVTDEDVTRRGLSFARLTELLVTHRDIYKKHIVGLVLEFVHALEDSLSVLRKEALLPAVFSLLDSLTVYETKQLNVLMSPKGKPLFQGVYHSYQKLHAYKGQ